MLRLACVLAAAGAYQPESKPGSLLQRTTFNKFSDLPEQYHTYDNLLQSVRGLEAACREKNVDVSYSHTTDEGVRLDVIHLRSKKDTDDVPRFRVGAVYGEHSRELISPETGLATVRAICGVEAKCKDCTSDHTATFQSLLDVGEKARAAPMDWAIVMNGNPETRHKLETTGDFCLRLDPDGVDPNRNYDDHFEPRELHGPRAFSQPETRALKSVLESFKPNAYFSIHSGELGLYGPHAWETASHDFPEFKVLDEVKPLCPDCPVGPAGKLQGRPLTGSSFDYTRDILKSDYSYAFEVFIDRNESPNDPDSCFRFFNPATSDQYTDVTNRFAATVLSTALLSRDHSLALGGDASAASDEKATEEKNMRSAFAQMPVLRDGDIDA